jgi:hypothetical protein
MGRAARSSATSSPAPGARLTSRTTARSPSPAQLERSRRRSRWSRNLTQEAVMGRVTWARCAAWPSRPPSWSCSRHRRPGAHQRARREARREGGDVLKEGERCGQGLLPSTARKIRSAARRPSAPRRARAAVTARGAGSAAGGDRTAAGAADATRPRRARGGERGGWCGARPRRAGRPREGGEGGGEQGGGGGAARRRGAAGRPWG